MKDKPKYILGARAIVMRKVANDPITLQDIRTMKARFGLDLSPYGNKRKRRSI